MPAAPKKPQPAPGRDHGAETHRRTGGHRRGSARQRGYSTAWSKLADSFKSRNPLCRVCQVLGLATPTSFAHHCHPIAQGGTVMVPDSMLIAVCETCHPLVENAARQGILDRTEQIRFAADRHPGRRGHD